MMGSLHLQKDSAYHLSKEPTLLVRLPVLPSFSFVPSELCGEHVKAATGALLAYTPLDGVFRRLLTGR